MPPSATPAPYPHSGWNPPPPGGGGNTGLIVGALIAVVLVLISGGAGSWWILSRTGSAPSTASTPSDTSDSGDDPSPGPSAENNDSNQGRKEAAAADMTAAFASVSTGDPGTSWCTNAYAFDLMAVYTDLADCLHQEAVVEYFEDYSEYTEVFSRFEVSASSLTLVNDTTFALRVADWRTPSDCVSYCEGMEDSTVVHYLQNIAGRGWQIVGRTSEQGEEGVVPSGAGGTGAETV